MASQASKSKSRSKAPTNAAAPNAAVHSEQSAVDATSGSAATPPGLSVPGGSTNTSGESGDAAGKASAEPVNPMAGPEQTKAMTAEAATPADADMPPEGEASASETDSTDNPGEKQETAEVGGGAPAASAAAIETGIDLAEAGTDLKVLWPSYEEGFKSVFPLTYALFKTTVFGSFAAGSVPRIRVTSKIDGFRRGGVAYAREPIDYLPGEIDPARLGLLLAEPILTVTIV